MSRGHLLDALIAACVVLVLVVIIAISLGSGDKDNVDCFEALEQAERIFQVDQDIMMESSFAFEAAARNDIGSLRAADTEIKKLGQARASVLDEYHRAASGCKGER